MPATWPHPGSDPAECLQTTQEEIDMNVQKLLAEKSRIMKSICLIACLVCAWYWRAPLSELFMIISDRDAVVAYLEQYDMWGPIVLFLILSAQVFLAIIPGHAFMISGGYIYGFISGALITYASTVLASQLAFMLARKAGQPFVERMAPANVIDKWNQLAEKQGAFFFFFSFILPIFPNDLMCFIAGLSSIKPRDFFIANIFGRLPCAIFITLIGSHGLEMPIQFWIMISIVVIGLCVSWKHISKYLEGRGIAAIQTVSC
jgi:uncharacterized membrane protein YdjX (TVP38/TMEM64 family)